MVRVVLVDINPKMVQAWRSSFEDNPEVEIVQGSMLEQTVSAWVSPTNAQGNMDGGLDAIVKNQLGGKIEVALKREIARSYGGSLPLGHATCVATGAKKPQFLISTPTMHASSEDVSATLNVALACAAAFQAVQLQNEREPGSIESVALPGLGANTGKVPVEICADLMWTGYNLFRAGKCADFESMRAALEEQLGDLGPMGKPSAKPTTKPAAKAPPTAAPPPSVKKQDEDFDDF